MMSIIEKPWGREIIVTHNERYALKDIRMVAGTRSSLQYHEKKLETILVIEGKISVETEAVDTGRVTREFGAGDSYEIQPGTRHRVTVLEDARLIEVSTPELDDVVRVEDDFGRA